MEDNLIGSYPPSEELPCGKQINQEYIPNSFVELECCRTVCPEKSNREIDFCYDMCLRMGGLMWDEEENNEGNNE